METESSLDIKFSYQSPSVTFLMSSIEWKDLPKFRRCWGPGVGEREGKEDHQ